MCQDKLGTEHHKKRSDGYHDLETVFCPVPIADILTIEKTENLRDAL